ncbi:response regulator [Paenibacillus sp. B2(2019)]|uniref:response regulator transcription factor n=1 Tax=Paenibacillus sp. B2(2019) TaxID=2607754 RepID=UPI00165F8B20|nr:response regulator [Paenibacillus sp. B2(2019)]
MIKAVVVDDERLVRKGFISLIDWSSLGVVIVGEAGDGKSALELLQQQDVDLLFVDLTMPGISGFELIKLVRQRFAGIRCVVLTCHHEFDYVQEAMRLGAVDYIVKTLLEMENADETIRRLVDRIKWEDNTRDALVHGEGKRIAAGKALLYLPLSSHCNEEELFHLSFVKNNPLITFHEMWMSPLLHRFSEEEGKRELKNQLSGRWQTALISGLRDQSLQELEEQLTTKLRHMLFYHSSAEELTFLNYEELKKEIAVPHLKPAEADLFAQAQNLKWTIDGNEWENFVTNILLQKPRQDRFLTFAHSLLQSWSSLLLKSEDAVQLERDISFNLNWCHWKTWLRRFSDHVGRRMLELGLTKEVMSCLIRAVRYMQSHAGDKINQSDVAAEINMSRGYFSQCFARFAGETFGECLRGMRLELAKSLLRETSLPVCEIASRSGFEDDRYFSRLFKERIGQLPSEYRSEGKDQ